MPTIQRSTGSRLRGDLLVVAAFEGGKPTVAGLPANVRRALTSAAGPAGFKRRAGQMLAVGLPGGRGQAWIYGLGAEGDFDRERLGAWLVRLASDADRDGHRSISIVLPAHELLDELEAALAVYEALDLCDYRFEAFRSTDRRQTLRTVRLVVSEARDKTYRTAARLSKGIVHGIRAARDLGNTPPNAATPAWIASRCRALGKEAGIDVRVLGPRELERRKMGGILAVGGGSANPPRLVRMAWGKRGPIVALVGKGVTFDTGGISIKPSAAMDEMKYDKCGACAVIGIALAAAALKLPFRFRAYVPLAENMPDGTAYRPGDIVRCYDGTTVEILNTDAEGRMILADALAWAKREKPDYILEYSTLTGATVVALGNSAAALYTPDDELATELLEASERAGDRLWRMPLWPEFKRAMKGHHGDLKNLGGRWGGANHAAAFLSHFVGDHAHWAHMDIAGPAYIGAGQKGTRGATGYGVGLTLQWLLRRAGKI